MNRSYVARRYNAPTHLGRLRLVEERRYIYEFIFFTI